MTNYDYKINEKVLWRDQDGFVIGRFDWDGNAYVVVRRQSDGTDFVLFTSDSRLRPISVDGKGSDLYTKLRTLAISEAAYSAGWHDALATVSASVRFPEPAAKTSGFNRFTGKMFNE